MNKDDSDRVFDVSKPNKSTPSPTSRPIIVGHHPMMSDPMVKEDNEDQESTPTTMHKSIPIQGSDDPAQTPDDVSPTLAPAMVQHPESVKAAVGPPPVLNEAPAPINQMPSDDLHLASLDDLIGHEHKPPEHQTSEHQPMEHQHSEHHGTVVHPHQDHNHEDQSHEDHNHEDSGPTVAHTAQRGHVTGDKKLSMLLVLLLVLVAGYLAIDSRLIKTSINLPFHIFKQPAPAVVVQPVVTKAAAKSTATTSTTTDPYADWQTHTDDFLTLKYPNSWTVVRNDNSNLPGTKNLMLYGPNDSQVASSTEVTKGHKASLALTIFKDTVANPDCNCKVYDVMSLTLTQLTTAKLAVTSDTKLGGDPTTPATDLLVTNDSKAVTGVTKIGDDLAINSEHFEVRATVNDNDTPDIKISDVTAFEKSESVKDLIKIINSINFK